MKISYSQTLSEFYRYQWLLFRHSFSRYPLMTRLYLALVLLIILYLLAVDCLQYYSPGMPLSPEIEHHLIFGLLPIIYIPVVLAVVAPIAWRLNKRHLVEIDKETVGLQQGRHKLRLRWRAIDCVDQDDDYIYIGSKYVGAKWPVPGVLLYAMLPKRAFPSPGEPQAFFGQATDYWNEAVGKPAEEALSAWPPAPVERETSKP